VVTIGAWWLLPGPKPLLLERDAELAQQPVLSASPSERRRLLSGPARAGAGALGLAAGDSPASEFAAVHGLYWLSVNLADRKPLLLTVDDLQWVDRRAARPGIRPELMTWMAGQVASYKRIPEVEFTDRIPRSPSGKILRRLLTEGDARAGHPPRASTGGAPAPAVTGPLRWQASLPGRPGRGCAQLVSAARKLAAS
jgi:hypothetical protein